MRLHALFRPREAYHAVPRRAGRKKTQTIFQFPLKLLEQSLQLSHTITDDNIVCEYSLAKKKLGFQPHFTTLNFSLQQKTYNLRMRKRPWIHRRRWQSKIFIWAAIGATNTSSRFTAYYKHILQARSVSTSQPKMSRWTPRGWGYLQGCRWLVKVGEFNANLLVIVN